MPLQLQGALGRTRFGLANHDGRFGLTFAPHIKARLDDKKSPKIATYRTYQALRIKHLNKTSTKWRGIDFFIIFIHKYKI